MNTAQMATSLNFSWLLEGQVAGCASPMLAEDLQFLGSQGIRALVRLAYPGKDDYVIDSSEVKAAGLEDLHIPVEDFHAPSLEQIEEALDFISSRLKAGKPVAVSCGAGCGRTGTILACYLITKGHDADSALRLLIERRPCSKEILGRTAEQKHGVYEFERHFHAAGVQL